MVEPALSHTAAARLDLDASVALARSLGIGSVEIRNDLSGVPLQNGVAPADEVGRLADEAKGVSAKAVVLCPVNEDGFWTDDAARLAALL